MERITLSVDEIILAKRAIDTLMSIPGIPFKKTYWFGRLRDHLSPSIKKWITIAREIYLKYAIKFPTTPYVPYEKYEEFKEELIHLMEFESNGSITGEEVLNHFRSKFDKYESIEGSGQYGIPIGSKEDYEKETQEAKSEFSVEIEYNKIETDENLLGIIQKLPGEFQLAIAFALTEENPSGLILLKKTTQ